MALVIERVDYSHLVGNPDLRDGVGEFRMNVTYPGKSRPSARFTRGEFLEDKRMLTRMPAGRLSFIIGAFTAFYDPQLRRLPDEYMGLIGIVRQTLSNVGFDTYNCFEREDAGQKSMRSGYATVLDGLALQKSRFLTKLPGSFESEGTDKEIDEATKLGIDIVGLFRADNPELEHQQRIKEMAAVHGGRSGLTFITYASQTDLVVGLTAVAGEMRAE